MSHHGVGVGGTKIVGGKSLEYFMRQTIGGCERYLERSIIRDAGTVQIGGSYRFFCRELCNLFGRTMHEHHPNIQRMEHSDIQEQIGKIHMCHHRAVGRNDARLIAESRYVLQYASEVGGFHVVLF